MRRALSMATFFSRAFNELPRRCDFPPASRAFCNAAAPARNCQLRIWHASEDISDGLSRVAKDYPLAIARDASLRAATVSHLLFNVERAPERGSVVNTAH